MKFKVIEGGLATAEAPRPSPAGMRPGAIEEERLRQAILRLPVPDTGITVEAALDEVCARLDNAELSSSERLEFLCWQMQQELGLRFQLVNPALGLARDGFLSLFNPAALLHAHPELAGLHPKAHPFLHVG
ncbi:hypothetical protein ACG02S_16470 [Roseateles sp. DC23W]|uniref:Uncharacterized protein n=1 Tax=Pelomonas dachongensis TaxID=3299029 RepID=A0ABW7EPX2_9BURK